MIRFRMVFLCGAVVLLAGCSATPGGAAQSTESASAQVSASASTSTAASAMPQDTAFASFNSVLKPLAGTSIPKGSDVTAALTSQLGVPMSALTVSADRTPTNLDVDTISVAYRYNDTTCFVGQFIEKEYVSAVAAPVNGVCLIGQAGS